MDFGLKDKNVLVMASGGGIGKAVAAGFASEGANIMLFDLSEDKLKNAQAEIGSSTGNEPLYTVGDITKYEDIQKVVKNTAQSYGSVDILFNNTGGPPAGGFDNFEDDKWQYAFELNLLSYVRTIREVLPYMRKNGWGRIVNNSSSSVKYAINNLLLSNTFRLGIVGMTKTLAIELGKENILANVVGAGRIHTERVDQLDKIWADKSGVSVEEFRQDLFKKIPLGRYGKPEEFAKIVLFLCSESNTYITGQTVLIDGGFVTAY